MAVYDRSCVLQIKRARCALNKEILDILNEEAFLDRAVIAGLQIPEKCIASV